MLHKCSYLLLESTNNEEFNHQIFKVGEKQDRIWNPPPAGAVRVDVDASVLNQQLAACGGLIRNYKGEWIVGFHRDLGACSITEVELLAIKTGLHLAVSRGHSRIVVYSDSLDAMNLLMRECTTSHPLHQLVESTRELIYSSGLVELKSARREVI